MPVRSATPKVIYAANRPIGLQCLRLLMKAGIRPVALLVPEGENAEKTAEMKKLLKNVPVFSGKQFREKRAEKTLRRLEPDYILSVHFPLIIPKEILRIPTNGTLNLHPAYLPWNRGWHTPTWAIIDGTPYGATLHWVDDGIDTGPIALQKRIRVKKTETADELYQRALAAEVAVFKKALPLLKKNKLPKKKQRGKGTVHKKAELESVRELHPERMTNDEVQKRIRALTTNNPEESAYLEIDGERFLIR